MWLRPPLLEPNGTEVVDLGAPRRTERFAYSRTSKENEDKGSDED